MKGREPAEPMAGQCPKACESGTVRFPARGGVAGEIEPVPNGARCLRLSSVDPVGVRLEGMRDGEARDAVTVTATGTTTTNHDCDSLFYTLD